MEEFDFDIDVLRGNTHVQNMKKSFPDYPCCGCKTKCGQQGCCKWKKWFSRHWQQIRETGLEIQRDRDIRNGLLELRGIYTKEDLER